jgi:type II secretory ATPase GspE/PulE/Tfp pilus assembly ATPase PilB-like protein
MDIDILLDLQDKRILEAQLFEPFSPDRGEINVRLNDSLTIQKFLFPELCCLMMRYDPGGLFQTLSHKTQEEVTTYSNNTYHVYVAEEPSAEPGFWGLSIQQDLYYRVIYFIRSGVKTRCQKRVVGEILQEKGLISSDSLHLALQEQQLLKRQKTGIIISQTHDLPRSVIEKTLADAIASKKVRRGARIGEILVAYNLVTQKQVEEALDIKKQNEKKKIGELLIELGYISEANLLAALATKFRIQIVDLSNLVPNLKALEALPSEIVRQLHVFPVADRGDRLSIATSQPTEYAIEDQLRFYTGRKIEMVIATTAQIASAIEKYYPPAAFVMGELSDDLQVDQEMEPDVDSDGLTESDSKIVNIVNKILIDAYQQRASDIHFEPGFRDAPFNIRYRIDGMCRVIHQIPLLYKKAVISRLKIMANLDITERRKPQSGKILLKHQSNKIEYRVEITPTTGNNEDAVLRVLASSKPLPLDRMGFSAENLKAFSATLAQPYGIILCVGPTGSGKTTTLHSALAHLNTPERKIWTAEDPVEITQQGLRQVQIQNKIGLTFAEVLRSFLRADPDVIMIGEMRDAETAKTAIEASLTGHLVLSTLHTNSAPETIIRLIEMGMDPYNFADALLCVVAQRLTRKLCDHCKQSYHPAAEEVENIIQLYSRQWYLEHHMPTCGKDLQLMRREGCDQCSGTGYRGRVALHEIALGTENLKAAIKKGATADELKSLAIQEGMRTLLMDGVSKIYQGLTDVEQVLKVCSSQPVGH